jgi:hypothetical protein
MSIKTLSLGECSAAAAGIVISTTSNATPIVATLAANHGLKDGDRIAIAGVTGNTAANGEWTLRFTGTNTAALLGSVGNGAHGGTVRVAVICDTTPTMKSHSAMLALSGNPIGTLDIEAYDTIADFAAGANAAAITAPAVSNSAPGLTNTNGSTVLPAKSTLVMALTNAGIEIEVKLARYMRMVCTAYTSGSVQAKLQA